MGKDQEACNTAPTDPASYLFRCLIWYYSVFFFKQYISSHALLNVSQLNHLSKISTATKQKGDSGLKCEKRQLLINNTQYSIVRHHHSSYDSRVAAEFC